MKLSSVLRQVEDNGLTFWCPGCNHAHLVRFGEGAGPRWTWDGNAERPTFSPSILVRGESISAAGQAAFEAWCAAGCPQPMPDCGPVVPTVCHSFVVDGQIQFLADCTHALAGHTVQLPTWPGADK